MLQCWKIGKPDGMHCIMGSINQQIKKKKGVKTLYALGNRSNKHLVAWIGLVENDG
ncbi:hypothetical protein Hanom_Chr12g01154641 [Helianthus anomalus]